MMDNEINSLDEKNNNLSKRIDKLTELENASTRDKYNLFDPTFNESISFLENNTTPHANKTVNLAKENGLRCALVEIEINKDWMYEIVAFETVDKGICFFETKSTYRVIPELNKNYNECVFDENDNHPYDPSFSEPITDILVIW